MGAGRGAVVSDNRHSLAMGDSLPDVEGDWEHGLTTVELVERVVEQLRSEVWGDELVIVVRTYLPI